MTSTARIRERFLDFRRRLYNAHDLTAIDDHLHPEFSSHSANVRPLLEAARQAALAADVPHIDVRPAYKEFAKTFHVGLPDLRPVRQEVLVEEASLMAMTFWEGTHTGVFFGVPATGKVLHFSTADRYRLQDGLLIEHWDVVDALEAWIALGIVVRPGGA
ncbi:MULTISPECIES: ester cyclase [unclassified Variovorax]|uniref:ester cyclase n=1 Tax=unclassified Variovorax TaxID=663243 RepID=UPI003F489EAD